MHIHFVCTGNAHRSRLAEAYCRSKIAKQAIKISSSGIGANKYRLVNGPITWYSMRILKRQKLIPFMSWQERQTTKKILQDVDLLICMNQKQLKYCQNKLGYQGKFEVWNIPDLDETDGFIPSTVPGIETDINNIQLVDQVYDIITRKVDVLIKELN